MKIVEGAKSLVLPGEDGGEMRIHYDNRGEPYREGVTFDVSFGFRDEFDKSVNVFLDRRSGRAVRDLMNRLFPD